MKQVWLGFIMAGLVVDGSVVGQATQPAPAPATAPAAGSVDIESEVDHWIKGLSHENWAERQAAEEGLIEVGDAAVARVKRLLEESDDPNLLASAENILAQIERLRAEGPARVTLHFDDVSAKEVIDALVRQTGQAIAVSPEQLWDQAPRGSITIHLDRAPFWLALREICLQGGLRIQDMNTGPTITLVQGGDDRLRAPFCQTGPFMVVATSTHEQRTVTLGRVNLPNVNRGLQMTVYAEPKLAIIGRSWQPVIEELIGADGTVYPVTRSNNGMNVGRQDWMWIAAVSLPSDANLTGIARLKGYLPVLRLVRAETSELDLTQDVDGKELEVAGHRLVVRSRMHESDSTTVLKLTLHARGGDRAEDPLGQVNTLMESISVVDAEGRPLTRAGSSGSGNNEKYDYEIRYSRQGPGRAAGEAARLRWNVPLEASEMKIPFEFTDIPLP